MSRNSENIHELSARKQALLQLMMKEKEGRASREKVIPRRVGSGPAPLSFAQERLWFLDQLTPGSCAYNLLRTLRVEGHFNVAAAERAVNEVLRRHEILRTSFQVFDGKPGQVVKEPMPVQLSIHDVRGNNRVEKEAELRRVVADEMKQSFDLQKGELFRIKVLRLDASEHVLMHIMHHIISDAWSAGVLAREVSLLYEAFAKGEASPLAELPIQYADYAVWQREWLQGEVLAGQLKYWREQLAGVPEVLELPTDRPRPAVQGYAGGVVGVGLSQELSEGLLALSRANGVTLFMTLLAGLKVVLSRHSGQEDIVVGSPIANRNRGEIEGLIGFFVNTLVLRTDVSGNPTVRELLGRIREQALGAYEHQDVPFEQLVQELAPQRSLSHSPLFQVMFLLQNVGEPGRAGKEEGVPGLVSAKFDLMLGVAETEEGIRGTWEYSADLFDRETIERMSGHWQRVLAEMVRQPERRLGELEMMGAAEREQVLVEWNRTQREYPDASIVELFEEQVEKRAEAVAVVCGEEELTYGQLNERANQLGHYLRKQGVGPEVRVGVCLKRSVEMVVGLLGILKAGGAYVPMDTNYPLERLEYMLRDAAITVLLTQTEVKSKLPAIAGRMICVDEEREEMGRSKAGNIRWTGRPENLAYVIYTSGSTGQPKGVAITHGSARALVGWGRETFGEEALREVLASTSITFDLSIFEMFVPLSCGGRWWW